MIHVCRYYTETTAPRSIGLVKISSAIDYMEKNYSEEISVDFLSNKANMASSSFRRIFKQTTGLTPTDFLIHLRIEKAAEMILQKGAKINQAARSYLKGSYEVEMFLRISIYNPDDKGKWPRVSDCKI